MSSFSVSHLSSNRGSRWSTTYKLAIICAFSSLFTTSGIRHASGQNLTADNVTVDVNSKNTGSVSYGLQFGGTRTIQLPGFAGHPGNFVTLPSDTGIASNRGPSGANIGGLDFYTPLFTAAIPRFSITAAGRVGIGTTSPSRALEIDQGGDVELGLKSTDGGTLWTIQSSAVSPQNTAAGLSATFQIIDRTQNLARLVIDQTGKVAVNVLQINGGSDVAEPFLIVNDRVREGSVLVIDEGSPGRLKLATSAYDTHVAGVASGAGGIKPGLSLQQKGLDGGQDVALSGRVYVLADATDAPIRPGDLLTTSNLPGYCMKALDRSRAAGAILGKAMGTLDHGQGMILALVSLQ